MLIRGESAIEFTDIGRWWGNDPREKKQAEIDIMGTAGNDAALFGECKWKNEKTDLSVLEKLVSCSGLFSYVSKHYYLFSKSGFTRACEEKAASMGNVTLVTYEEMIKLL